MMRERHLVTILALTSASARDQERGLLGWLSLEFGDLHVDGVALRRTSSGRLVLSWPARRDRVGRDHPVVWPAGDAARRAIEAQVFDALGEEALP